MVADAAIGGHVRNDAALASLVAGFVEVNPATLHEADLLAAASAVMQPLHDKALDAALERLNTLLGRGEVTACVDPAPILAAAHGGRVDQLFLARDGVLRGTFDPENGTELVEDEARAGTLDLLDKAAQMTLGNGGVVWLVAQDRLPKDTAMAANLRY